MSLRELYVGIWSELQFLLQQQLSTRAEEAPAFKLYAFRDHWLKSGVTSAVQKG